MAGRFGSWMLSVRAKSCLIIGTVNIDRPGEGPSSGSLVGRRPSLARNRPSIPGQVSGTPSSSPKEPQPASTASTTSSHSDGSTTYLRKDSAAVSHPARKWEDRHTDHYNRTRMHERVDTSMTSASRSSSGSTVSGWSQHRNWSQASGSLNSRHGCEFQPRRRNTPPPAHLLRSNMSARR